VNKDNFYYLEISYLETFSLSKYFEQAILHKQKGFIFLVELQLLLLGPDVNEKDSLN